MNFTKIPEVNDFLASVQGASAILLIRPDPYKSKLVISTN